MRGSKPLLRRRLELFSFTLAGNWNNGYNNQGSNGNYWSRTAYPSNSNNAYNLNLNSSNVNPQNNNNKNNGFSVRCVTS